MRFISTFLAIVAAIALSFTSAGAAERKVVPANKTSAVGFIYYSSDLGTNCQNPGRGKYKVTREAKYGSIGLEWRKIKGNFHMGCKNVTMPGLAVFYTPQKGFRGEDEFVVRLTMPGFYGPSTNVSRTWKFRVDVQ